jgi:hypothetical protein
MKLLTRLRELRTQKTSPSDSVINADSNTISIGGIATFDIVKPNLGKEIQLETRYLSKININTLS